MTIKHSNRSAPLQPLALESRRAMRRARAHSRFAQVTAIAERIGLDQLAALPRIFSRAHLATYRERGMTVREWRDAKHTLREWEEEFVAKVAAESAWRLVERVRARRRISQ